MLAPASSFMQPNLPYLSTPGVRALLHQLMAFLVTSFVTGLLASLLSLETIHPLVLLVVAAFQGALAAGLSWWRCLSAWWIPIQFAFPLAVIGLQIVALPSWIYLCAFLVLLGIYWGSYRTQVPYYPSSQAVGVAVAALLPSKRSFCFIDIGSGFGGLVLELAKTRPDARFEGVEIAPIPWLISRVRAHHQRAGVRFVLGDYERLRFSDYDVIFAYLSPAAMPRLWEKVSREMRPGTLLLSLEFPVPGVPSHFLVYPDNAGPPVYGWRF